MSDACDAHWLASCSRERRKQRAPVSAPMRESNGHVELPERQGSTLNVSSRLRHPQRTFRSRTQSTAASRRDRQHCRHNDRVVRLPPLRHSDRARVRQVVLPEVQPHRRRPGGVQRILHWLRRPTDRRLHLWPLGRPHRAQGNTDRHAAGHRHCDRGRRLRARLRQHRHLGRHPAHGHPPDPGHRRRRRMGRLRAAGDGVGSHQQEPRLPLRMAAIRRTLRIVPGELRSAVLQLVLR